MIKIIKNIWDLLNKIFKSNIVKGFAFAASAFKTFSSKLKKEFEDFKKKMRDAAIIFVFAVFGLLFLLIGLGFYIESRFPNLSGGIGFILMGVISIFLSFLYWLITK